MFFRLSSPRRRRFNSLRRGSFFPILWPPYANMLLCLGHCCLVICSWRSRTSHLCLKIVRFLLHFYRLHHNRFVFLSMFEVASPNESLFYCTKSQQVFLYIVRLMVQEFSFVFLRAKFHFLVNLF